MKDQKIKYYDLAYKNLKDANTELMRPAEDVVSMLVCKNAQMAIENYLKGYLSDNRVDTTQFKTIAALYTECLRLNPMFEKIDLKDFNCSYFENNTRYCEEVSKVSRCYKVANSLDDFIRNERNMS